MLSLYSSAAHSGLLLRSRYSCTCRGGALPLPCSRWMCFAAHPSGRGQRACESEANVYHTNRTFNCQYNRPDRTTRSSSRSGHRSPAKYQAKIAYLETSSHAPDDRALDAPRLQASSILSLAGGLGVQWARPRHANMQDCNFSGCHTSASSAVARLHHLFHSFGGLRRGGALKNMLKGYHPEMDLQTHGAFITTRCCLLLHCLPISITGR